ncbi:MAG TPA: signal peptide peptidase SppA [Bacteroidales bacterium]|nr:signal peptide peptidase SppA [Bacteroidales bacterium]HQI46496.1 signal peptide peptidase SppA [Bacteroidales bacterium]
MKQFFKFMFASMTGSFILIVILFFILMGMVLSVASLSKKEVVVVPENSILQLKLNEEIADRSSSNPFNNFDFSSFKTSKSPGLNEILQNIKKAKTDDNIKGIFLDLGTIPSGIATIEEIRNALLDFKSSKKFIISYSEEYTQKAYYIASVSDKVYLYPEGALDFKGLNGEVMFFKGLLDKLDVDVQILRHGKFKSAVEPFVLDKMSEPNKEQTLKYISGIWNQMLEGISESRKMSIAQLNGIADSFKIQKAQDAVTYKLVDKLLYKDELLAELRNLLGIGKKEKINSISLQKYTSVPDKTKKIHKTKDKIAVIYALGEIVSGKGDDETIGSDRISEAIRKARLDSAVKAIVLRVNSPGGSALASDVIWREVDLSKKTKPVVVSMGDVAASGGYYIACAATRIVADPTTLTGSIGVFGLIPNLKGLFNNKLGVSFDNVKTNNYADIGSTYRPLTKSEENIYQTSVENIYETFITHVAEGRGMTKEKVDSIGQGRVWNGVDALEIGLIDEFGGLEKSIEIAAKLAKIEEYKIQSLPAQKDPFTQIMEELSGESTDQTILKNKLGELYEFYNYIQYVKNTKGVQARIPYTIKIY